MYECIGLPTCIAYNNVYGVVRKYTCIYMHVSCMLTYIYVSKCLKALYRYLGAIHKVRHTRGGEGVREGVTVCDRGRG